MTNITDKILNHEIKNICKVMSSVLSDDFDPKETHTELATILKRIIRQTAESVPTMCKCDWYDKWADEKYGDYTDEIKAWKNRILEDTK